MSSLFMIVGALFEFAIVLILKYHPSNRVAQGQGNPEISQCQTPNKNYRWTTEEIQRKCLHEKIDYTCFRMFPIVYILFNAIYFSVFNIV